MFQSELPEILYLERLDPERASALGRSARRMGYDSIDEYAAAVRRLGRVFFDVEAWFDFVRGQDLVIGTRLHGAVAALLPGGARHRRLPRLAHARDLRAARGSATSASARPGACRSRPLYDRVDFDELTPRHGALIPRYVDFLERNGVVHRIASGTTRASC